MDSLHLMTNMLFCSATLWKQTAMHANLTSGWDKGIIIIYLCFIMIIIYPHNSSQERCSFLSWQGCVCHSLACFNKFLYVISVFIIILFKQFCANFPFYLSYETKKQGTWLYENMEKFNILICKQWSHQQRVVHLGRSCQHAFELNDFW